MPTPGPYKPKLKPSTWNETTYTRVDTPISTMKRIEAEKCQVVPGRDIESWVKRVAVEDPQIAQIGAFTLASLNVEIRGSKVKMVSENRYDFRNYFPGAKVIELASAEEMADLFPNNDIIDDFTELMQSIWESMKTHQIIMDRSDAPILSYDPAVDIIVEL